MFTADEARALVRSRDDLEAEGLTSRGITDAVRSGRVVRVHPGRFVDAATWRGLYPEGRHLVRLVACHSARRAGGAVASHVSGAVAWQLPLYRLEPRRVHLSGAGENGQVRRSEPVVARHEVAVPERDRVIRDGIPCTSLPRTVADCIRSLPMEASLSIADAAIRAVAWNAHDHTYDEDAAARLRAEIAARLPTGGRGVRAARRTLELADGRAQLPGESVSRLYLLELGFPKPRLQVPIAGPSGGWYYVDFGLDAHETWGEFDGTAKYLDPTMRSGSIERAVLEEKEREDWIRGTTKRSFARWGTAHIPDAHTLGRRLASFGLAAP